MTEASLAGSASGLLEAKKMEGRKVTIYSAPSSLLLFQSRDLLTFCGIAWLTPGLQCQVFSSLAGLMRMRNVCMHMFTRKIWVSTRYGISSHDGRVSPGL